MQLAYISSCWSCEGLPKGHEGGHSAKGALVRGIGLGQNLIELNEFLNVRGRSRKGRQDVEGAAEK